MALDAIRVLSRARERGKVRGSLCFEQPNDCPHLRSRSPDPRREDAAETEDWEGTQGGQCFNTAKAGFSGE